jgi:hypothetical protein
MKRTLAIPALLFLAVSATAQTPAQTKNPVSTALRGVLPGEQKNTVAAVEAMPADKFSYKPSADQMTFGHLVVHMPQRTICCAAGSPPFPLPRLRR